MALPTAYLATTRNVEPLLNSLITARAPETFTHKFLQGLDFKSTNDRLYITVLKGLGFLTETGAPTERYFAFLDQAQSKKVMAAAIKEAYSDLFDINTKAHELSEQDIKSKLRTLTQGKYSDGVTANMAKTFKALSEYAEWGESSSPDEYIETVDQAVTEEASDLYGVEEPKAPLADPEITNKTVSSDKKLNSQLHYNIQIHLPETRDPVVYDAIFKSLKNHLEV